MDSQELHIKHALRLCYKIFNSPDESTETKAVALCWIIHLVADAHQPCHAGSFSVEYVFPEVDRGVNSIPTKQSKNLHPFWDGLLGRSFDEGGIRRRIMETNAISQAHNSVGISGNTLRLDDWLGESRETAQAFVYASDVSQSISESLRDKIAAVRTVDLSEKYLKDAGYVAHLRALQASTRLADMLRQTE